jgi:acyl carrier protein
VEDAGGGLDLWLGVRSQDGAVDLIGRQDALARIAGLTVQLDSLDAYARACAAASDAAVAPVTLGPSQGLACYVAGAREVEPEMLLAALADALPTQLVPSLTIPVATIDRRPDGTVVRSALPSPARIGPRNGVERRLCSIWAEILERDEISVVDSFFELGGESLSALLICDRISREIGVSIALRRFFELETIAAVAEEIGGNGRVVD